MKQEGQLQNAASAVHIRIVSKAEKKRLDELDAAMEEARQAALKRPGRSSAEFARYIDVFKCIMAALRKEAPSRTPFQAIEHLLAGGKVPETWDLSIRLRLKPDRVAHLTTIAREMLEAFVNTMVTALLVGKPELLHELAELIKHQHKDYDAEHLMYCAHGAVHHFQNTGVLIPTKMQVKEMAIAQIAAMRVLDQAVARRTVLGIADDTGDCKFSPKIVKAIETEKTHVARTLTGARFWRDAGLAKLAKEPKGKSPHRQAVLITKSSQIFHRQARTGLVGIDSSLWG